MNSGGWAAVWTIGLAMAQFGAAIAAAYLDQLLAAGVALVTAAGTAGLGLLAAIILSVGEHDQQIQRSGD